MIDVWKWYLAMFNRNVERFLRLFVTPGETCIGHPRTKAMGWAEAEGRLADREIYGTLFFLDFLNE